VDDPVTNVTSLQTDECEDIPDLELRSMCQLGLSMGMSMEDMIDSYTTDSVDHLTSIGFDMPQKNVEPQIIVASDAPNYIGITLDQFYQDHYEFMRSGNDTDDPSPGYLPEGPLSEHVNFLDK